MGMLFFIECILLFQFQKVWWFFVQVLHMLKHKIKGKKGGLTLTIVWSPNEMTMLNTVDLGESNETLKSLEIVLINADFNFLKGHTFVV